MDGLLRASSPSTSSLNFRRALSVLERQGVGVFEGGQGPSTTATGTKAGAGPMSPSQQRSGGGAFRPGETASPSALSLSGDWSSGGGGTPVAGGPATGVRAERRGLQVGSKRPTTPAEEYPLGLSVATSVPYELPSTRRFKGVSVAPGGGGGASVPREHAIHSLDASQRGGASGSRWHAGSQDGVGGASTSTGTAGHVAGNSSGSPLSPVHRRGASHTAHGRRSDNLRVMSAEGGPTAREREGHLSGAGSLSQAFPPQSPIAHLLTPGLAGSTSAGSLGHDPLNPSLAIAATSEALQAGVGQGYGAVGLHHRGWEREDGAGGRRGTALGATRSDLSQDGWSPYAPGPGSGIPQADSAQDGHSEGVSGAAPGGGRGAPGGIPSHASSYSADYQAADASADLFQYSSIDSQLDSIMMHIQSNGSLSASGGGNSASGPANGRGQGVPGPNGAPAGVRRAGTVQGVSPTLGVSATVVLGERRSADISFIADKSGHGSNLRGFGDGDGTRIPPTLIPKEHHVTETASAVPEDGDAAEWRKLGPRMYVKQVFPSIQPSGRQEAIMLSQLLDGMLERYQAMKYTMGPRHLIRESQRIHSVCMFEVVRQVSVHCIERGVLLKRVWEGYGDLFERLWKVSQDMLDAMKRHFEDLLAALRSEMEALIKKIAELQDEIKRRDEEIARLAAENERLAANAMTDDVKQRLKDLEEENASLLDEVRKLRAALRQMTAAHEAYRIEAEGWKVAKEAAEKKAAALEKEVAALKKTVVTLEEEIRRLREKLHELVLENAEKAAMIAALEATVASLQAQVKELQAQMRAAMLALASAKAQVPGKKETSEKQCQTDGMPMPTAVVQAELEEGGGDPGPSKDKDKKKKKALKMPEAPPWPLTNTLKTIQLIYADKIKADAVDDACNNDRQNMQDYVGDWFKNQYGTGPMNKEAQAKFAATLRKFRDTNPYCNTFGRLWGVFDALDESWCDYYLEILSFVIKAPVTHPTEEIVLPTKMNMAFMVKTKFANDVLMQVLGAEMEPKYAAAISARLNTSSEKFGAKGLKFLDQERLMTIAMEEKKLMTDRLSKMLEYLFSAGDTNGDGVLDMDEFTAIVRYVDPLVKTAKIEVMHKEALTEGTDSMTPDDFARVCIANGLLKSPAAKTRLASGFDDDDERSNEEIFAELKAKWDVRGEEMMSRIEEVEDEELKESLLARVARHNELLAAGEEPDTTAIARSLAMAAILAATARTSAAMSSVTSTLHVASGMRRWMKRAAGTGPGDGSVEDGSTLSGMTGMSFMSGSSVGEDGDDIVGYGAGAAAVGAMAAASAAQGSSGGEAAVQGLLGLGAGGKKGGMGGGGGFLSALRAAAAMPGPDQGQSSGGSADSGPPFAGASQEEGPGPKAPSASGAVSPPLRQPSAGGGRLRAGSTTASASLRSRGNSISPE